MSKKSKTTLWSIMFWRYPTSGLIYVALAVYLSRYMLSGQVFGCCRLWPSLVMPTRYGVVPPRLCLKFGRERQSIIRCCYLVGLQFPDAAPVLELSTIVGLNNLWMPPSDVFASIMLLCFSLSAPKVSLDDCEVVPNRHPSGVTCFIIHSPPKVRQSLASSWKPVERHRCPGGWSPCCTRAGSLLWTFWRRP